MADEVPTLLRLCWNDSSNILRLQISSTTTCLIRPPPQSETEELLVTTTSLSIYPFVVWSFLPIIGVVGVVGC